MPSYDEITTKAQYLGTEIRTGVPSQQYKDNFDRIFGKQLTKQELRREESQYGNENESKDR